VGVLTIGDIVSTDLTVGDGVSTVALNGEIEFGGSALTATSTGLFFDYSQAGVFGVVDGSATSAYCLGAQATACGIIAQGSAIEFQSAVNGSPLGVGVVQIAAASPVPEPATWAMMVLGFAGIGLVGYRRAAKPAIG
jgi:hypothetical protein